MSKFYNKMKSILLESAYDDLLKAAADPMTHPDVLHSMKNNPDIGHSDLINLRLVMAKNPNIHIGDWFDLLQEHPRESLENTALPLWELEQPDMWHRIIRYPSDTSDLMHIDPLKFGTIFSNSPFPRVVQSIGSHSRTPPDILEQLAKHSLKEVRGAVARNINTPPDVLSSLVNDPSEHVKRALSTNTNTPIETLHILSKHTDDSDCRCEQLLNNPTTSKKTVDNIHKTHPEPTRPLMLAFLKNKFTPFDIIRNSSFTAVRPKKK